MPKVHVAAAILLPIPPPPLSCSSTVQVEEDSKMKIAATLLMLVGRSATTQVPNSGESIVIIF